MIQKICEEYGSNQVWVEYNDLMETEEGSYAYLSNMPELQCTNGG